MKEKEKDEICSYYARRMDMDVMDRNDAMVIILYSILFFVFCTCFFCFASCFCALFSFAALFFAGFFSFAWAVLFFLAPADDGSSSRA
jgi:hypothetical protein